MRSRWNPSLIGALLVAGLLSAGDAQAQERMLVTPAVLGIHAWVVEGTSQRDCDAMVRDIRGELETAWAAAGTPPSSEQPESMRLRCGQTSEEVMAENKVALSVERNVAVCQHDPRTSVESFLTAYARRVTTLDNVSPLQGNVQGAESCFGRVEVRLRNCPDLRGWNELWWLEEATHGLTLTCGPEDTTRSIPWYSRQTSPRVGVGEALLQGFALQADALFPASRENRPVIIAGSGGPGSGHYLAGVLLALDWMATDDAGSQTALDRVGAIVTTSNAGLAAAQAVNAQMEEVRMAGTTSKGTRGSSQAELSSYLTPYLSILYINYYLERQYYYPNKASVGFNSVGQLQQRPRYPWLVRARRFQDELLFYGEETPLNLANMTHIQEADAVSPRGDVPLWIPVALDMAGVSTFPVTETSLATRSPCWMPPSSRSMGRVSVQFAEDAHYQDWMATFDVGLMASVATAEDPLANPVVISTECARQPKHFAYREKRALRKANARLAPSGVPLVLVDGRQIDPYGLRTAAALSSLWTEERATCEEDCDAISEDVVVVRASTHPLGDRGLPIEPEWYQWSEDSAAKPVRPSKVSTHRWVRSLRAVAAYHDQGNQDIDLSYYAGSERYQAVSDVLVRYAYRDLSQPEEPEAALGPMHTLSDEYRLTGLSWGKSSKFKLQKEAIPYASAWTLHGIMSVAMSSDEDLQRLVGATADVGALKTALVCELMREVMVVSWWESREIGEQTLHDELSETAGVSCASGGAK